MNACVKFLPPSGVSVRARLLRSASRLRAVSCRLAGRPADAGRPWPALDQRGTATRSSSAQRSMPSLTAEQRRVDASSTAPHGRDPIRRSLPLSACVHVCVCVCVQTTGAPARVVRETFARRSGTVCPAALRLNAGWRHRRPNAEAHRRVGQSLGSSTSSNSAVLFCLSPVYRY